MAAEDLKDPNFEKSVVLVTRAPPFVGPFGVIVNRPTTILLREAFPDDKALEKLEDKIHIGGPVAVGKLMYLFKSPTKLADSEEMIEVANGVYLSWSAEKLKELLKREKPTEGMRVFAGHSAWAPGQLEAEVARGGWTSAQVDARSLFDTPPHLIWPELHRQVSGVRVNSRVDSDPAYRAETWVGSTQPPPSAFIRSTE